MRALGRQPAPAGLRPSCCIFGPQPAERPASEESSPPRRVAAGCRPSAEVSPRSSVVVRRSVSCAGRSLRRRRPALRSRSFVPPQAAVPRLLSHMLAHRFPLPAGAVAPPARAGKGTKPEASTGDRMGDRMDVGWAEEDGCGPHDPAGRVSKKAPPLRSKTHKKKPGTSQGVPGRICG